MPDIAIALPKLPRALADFTGLPAPSYHRLYFAALRGLIPAEQINGRWSVLTADLPAIARAFEMPVLAPNGLAGAGAGAGCGALAP